MCTVKSWQDDHLDSLFLATSEQQLFGALVKLVRLEGFDFDTVQSKRELAQAFRALNLAWIWQPVVDTNFEAVIDLISRPPTTPHTCNTEISHMTSTSSSSFMFVSEGKLSSFTIVRIRNCWHPQRGHVIFGGGGGIIIPGACDWLSLAEVVGYTVGE